MRKISAVILLLLILSTMSITVMAAGGNGGSSWIGWCRVKGDPVETGVAGDSAGNAGNGVRDFNWSGWFPGADHCKKNRCGNSRRAVESTRRSRSASRTRTRLKAGPGLIPAVETTSPDSIRAAGRVIHSSRRSANRNRTSRRSRTGNGRR